MSLTTFLKRSSALLLVACISLSLSACFKSSVEPDNDQLDPDRPTFEKLPEGTTNPNHYSTYLPVTVDGNEEMLRVNMVLDNVGTIVEADIHFDDADSGNKEKKDAFGKAASELLSKKMINDILEGVEVINEEVSATEGLNRGIKLIQNAATNKR